MEQGLTPETEREFRIFRRALPLRVKLDEIIRAAGNTEGLSCLEVGLGNGVMSRHLRRRGGKWHTAVSSEALAASVRALVPDNVYVMDGQILPFHKKVFDAVIVSDVLERFEFHEPFIEECHRILKPDGRLILIVANRKPVSVIAAVRRLLGSPREKRGLVVPGHTESELFSILKHGFDVHNLRTFSRFFVEITDACVESIALRMQSNPNRGERGVIRVYTAAIPFYALAAQLDMLLFFTRGHYLIVTAKRRAWHPRKTPVLADGRTIPEAVLHRAPR
ncbi:MAG: class I SAM-dependent methyltransferase [Verrucomicrobiota bacterium]|nr:class I SAM-dependent methyltransferase [Verrucomicrobiota bacterium]